MSDTTDTARGSRLHIARSRGALSGFLLILAGVWGALIPFVGPYFDFAYSPDTPWAWTAGRGWLQVLPGVVAVVGGVALLVSRNRATAMLGGWLGVAAGGWFIVGRLFASPLGLGTVGSPVALTEARSVLLELAFFSGLGALMVFLGAAALGRVSVRSVRDMVVGESAVRESIVGETAVVDTTTDADQVTTPTSRRSLKDRFLGSRRTPLAH